MSQESTVRWGIMGTARIAAKVAAAIRHSGNSELVAIASRSTSRARQWALQHNVNRYHGTYQALCTDDLDAIYIPLPPSMHMNWTMKCAAAGKHVLCEKPVATSLRDAIKLIDECQKNGVQFMDGTMWDHHPRTTQMAQFIQDGPIGSVQRIGAALTFSIESYLHEKPSLIAQADGSSKLDKQEIFANEFRLNPELGGGVLLDVGWYCVRAALWAFQDALPSRVFADAQFRDSVDWTLNAILTYEDGRVASFDCGFDSAVRRWMEVVGTDGRIMCDDFLSPWDNNSPYFYVETTPGNQQRVNSAPCLQEVTMIENFCDAILSGKRNERWPSTSIKTQQICSALAESAQHGKVVAL